MPESTPIGRAETLRHVLWLLTARWRIGYNSFKRGAGWRRLIFLVVLAALAFLSLASMAVTFAMSRIIIGVTDDPLRADVLVNSVFSGALVLSFMVSFTVALAALYLSRDLDLLLGAPLPRQAIFAAKLAAGLLPAHLMILGMTVIPLLGHGLAMEYDYHFYLATLLGLLLLPIIPIAVGGTAVTLIVRNVSAQRVGEVVGLVVVAMTLSIALVLGSARQLQEAVTMRDLLGLIERFRSPYSPAEWLTRAVTSAARLDIAESARWFGLLLGLGVIALVPLVLVSGQVYYQGWLRMQAASRQGEGKRGGFWPWARFDRAIDLGRPSGIFAWLPQPAVAVLRKDLRAIPRDLSNIAQVLSPLSIGIFFILQQLLYPIRFGSEGVTQTFARPVLAMLSAGIASGVSAMIMTRFALTAFSMEGRAYWVLKGAPIRRRDLVLGKFLVAYLPYLALGGLLVVFLEGARAVSDARLFDAPMLEALGQTVDPALLFYAWFVVAATGAGAIGLTLALGAARPNLRWDTPHEMLTPDLGCLSLVLYGGYGAVSGLLLGLPMAVSRFAMLRGGMAIWVVGLSLGLALTTVTTLGGLWVAAGELDAIGE